MSQYSRTFNSFSGIDITPQFAGKPIGELQGISWSVSREKAPLYTMGSANPRSFSRGKRGIAGSCVFLVFDREALLDTMSDKSLFWGNKWESGDAGTGGSRQVADVNNEASDPEITKSVLKADYLDQIPNFDAILSAVTERGHGAQMEILGMEILNCGSGVSIDDITQDQSCTWIGTRIKPWRNQTYHDPAENDGSTVYRMTGNKKEIATG